MKFTNDKIFYSLSWLINLILPFMVFGVFTEHFYSIYYNSDTLYLASIYKDLFEDGTGFKGWNLNGAPNFFPDMLLYFVVRLFSPDFKWAYIIFSALQYNLLLFLLGRLFKGINPKINLNFITLFNLIFPVYLLATILHGSFQYTFDVFSQSYHNGCFINTLVAMNFLSRYLRIGKKSYLIAMLAFVFVGTFNDRLFTVTFVAPLMAVLVFNFVWIKQKTIYKASYWTLGIAAFALFLFNAVKTNPIFRCINLGDKFMNFENAGPSLKNMVMQHSDFIHRADLRGLITLLTILSFIIIVVLFFRIAVQTKWFKKSNPLNQLAAVFMLFSMVSVFLTLATPVINGYYLGPSCIRYSTFSFFLSLFNTAFIVYWLTQKSKLIWLPWLTGALLLMYVAIVGYTAVTKPVFKTLHQVAAFYPEKIQKLDAFVKKHQLTYGVAPYWDAKYATMFSKENARVYTAINPELKVWFHVMNSNWYFDYDKGKYNQPLFNFVILDTTDFKITRELFGQPLDSLQLDRGKFVYLLPDFKYDRNTKNPAPAAKLNE